ncbi:putative membrane protein [Clostridium acetobutylicum]|uniref:Predicted membrane protein n=1 Tax=Clostridium acetobutylicum (strain ATCC 824 / DSM 792 / JCM 1419 / IAM 19013 / LMG 5710 / NBRC 13948 / NRRL B-527 / VKM B-1787 / 2291 / W) TaxID=272562 RepID=Q97IH5_CLOAB|nr:MULTISPECIES: membrane protein [Clostridium]AAK79632.1 Predicted membrane protein [Clostridium acetobutylicum ATCC 824]ADZ20716.1 membrane protein [Clostridium acetobutylicum EA 2018]AEI31935.1 hypothetical protein SMB_G1691 [Clostridium acetobutylicum DSM 1731]AWV79931.1 hypothetical protein DK921_07440 [Clostridium acetobutylicum]MBC2394083.1 hypothetical protein [Clostridium acetobutylicum]
MWTYSEYIIFFGIYSFIGWVLETIFASVNDKKIVNRGFLTGFFCPIYGFGAILTVQCSRMVGLSFKNPIISLISSVIFSIFLVTFLEYVTGFILEAIFNCKWWDYSNDAANIHGYICLKYSLLWGMLAFLLVQTIHPLISKMVFNISATTKEKVSIFLLVYFMIDTIKSVIDALNLRQAIMEYSNFSINKYRERILKYKRLIIAFPRLIILNRDIRRIVNDRFYKIKLEIKSKIQELF